MAEDRSSKLLVIIFDPSAIGKFFFELLMIDFRILSHIPQSICSGIKLNIGQE
jgi:hypothetical protein